MPPIPSIPSLTLKVLGLSGREAPLPLWLSQGGSVTFQDALAQSLAAAGSFCHCLTSLCEDPGALSDYPCWKKFDWRLHRKGVEMPAAQSGYPGAGVTSFLQVAHSPLDHGR